MGERELNELEDPGTWDSERVEVRPPAESGRAVISVAFSRDDFDRVSDIARDSGTKTSEFIRKATLDRIT